MTQWEFCRIAFLQIAITEQIEQNLLQRRVPAEIVTETDLLGETTRAIRIGRVNFLGQPAETKEQFTDLSEMLARLGRDGWEIVSHVVVGDRITDIFLKRPLPSSGGTAEWGSNPVSGYRGG